MADKNLNASLKIWIDGKEIPNTVNAITKEMKKLQREQKDMTLGSEEYVKQSRKIAELNTILSEHKKRLGDVSVETNKMSKAFKDILGFGIGGALGNAFSAVGNKIREAAQESVELAKQAEGIELAFNRLDKPGLLEKLRQETHGAVSDLTLMTQAVKFKDFNLPIEQLGTYLAYAQQKAKDTGQDLGFLVDSIVTGLGRQSLPILDNLGLSATEIRAEMAKSGDMFTAVANIIKKNMAEAGEYTETAADRAAQAAARLENAEIELGKELLPIKENADAAFNEIQIGAIEAIKWIVKHRNGVILLTGAILAYTVAQKAANISAETFNKIMKRSVWGLIAAAIAAVVVQVEGYIEKLRSAKKLAEELNDVESDAIMQYSEEASKIKTLDATMRDERVSLEERKKALNMLREIIPSYNGMLSEEGRLTRDNKSAIDDYLVSLQKQIRLKAYQGKLEELYKRRSEQEDAATEAQKELDKELYYTNHAGESGKALGILRALGLRTQDGLRRTLDKINEGIADTDSKIEQTIQRIAKASQDVNVFSSTNTNETPNPPKKTDKGGKVGKTGHTTKVESEDQKRQKQIEEARLKIEAEYQQKQNAYTKLYLETNILTREQYEKKIEELGMERLQKELNILGLEAAEKEKIMAKIYEVRMKWKEKEQKDAIEKESKIQERMKEVAEEALNERMRIWKMEEEKRKELSDQILQATEVFGSAFGDMMEGIFNGEEGAFKDFMRSILNTMLDAVEKQVLAVYAGTLAKEILSKSWAGIASAAGLLAVVTAAFETAKAAIKSFDSGGFTGPGAWNEEKGVVHANEFVANRHATANPSVMPVLSLIDAAQKSGSVANLTSADIASVLPTTSMVAPAGGNRSQQGNRELLGMLAAANKTNQLLLARLKQPLVAETYATGKRGVNEAQDLVEKMKSNVSRK